jgi:hypothetical protein
MRDEYVYEEKKVGKYTVKVVQDIDPIDPRKDWEPLGTMVCIHRRYNLGDVKNAGMEDIREITKRKDIFWLPLYLYDHSGITMSTGPFACPWDSGQVGIIYIEKEKFRKEWNCKRVNKKKVYDLLRAEVEIYDNYLTGAVYGFIVEDETGDSVDSCWGFFGDTKECLEEGIHSAQYCIRNDIKKHIEQVKLWIRNHVPLEKRKA